MVHFVKELPDKLEANAIYFVQWAPKRAELIVTDREGNLVEVANKEAIESCIAELRGEEGGLAGLTTRGKLYMDNMPEDVAYLDTVAQLQEQIHRKQDSLENAEALQAFGKGTYNGEPLITLSSQEW